MCYSGYDWRGNAKYLLDRSTDAAQCDVPGVPDDVRDEALSTLCDSFDIPKRQMYCLRPHDELMAIYQSFVGPRYWDDLEFERLWMALDELPGEKLDVDAFQSIKSVGDLICFVAERRAMRNGGSGA
jgi:hypothetical protein